MGIIEAICISETKGVVKKEIPKAIFCANWGIEGDAHVGTKYRQVSLLAGESIDRVKKSMPDLNHGAFAENIITRNVNLKSVKVGDKLQIGEKIILEITQIGKECHNACEIKKITGDCIMPKEGLFVQVIHGGEVVKGDQIIRFKE
ncbi:MOSC domain-containing protein [candidate division KSB1 bacterium]|nr:MOSC domain-containing protein [candidate division KSB1 bacterium]